MKNVHDGGQDVHQMDNPLDTLSFFLPRLVNHQGGTDLILVHIVSVAKIAMLTERLAVVSDNHDESSVHEAPFLQPAEEYRELGRVEVLEDRTWTVPSLADGRLFLRNEIELVCLKLTP